VVVGAGHVNFQGLNSARLDININPQLNRAIINWQSFSIDRGEVTSINQGANAFTLNRVVSGDPTAIYGQLKAAQGGVMVVNPNGIVVHQGGSVDVAGMLTLSTLDISNKDFLNGGTDRFRGTTAAGVRNYGAITSDGGDVVLLGNFLQNAGSVNAPRGVVAFGAGGDIVVDQAGESRISVQAGGGGGEVGIDNTGTVNAAAAELKAHGNVYALAIKNDGVVRASGYNFRGGRLTLSAGSQGRIVNTGNLTARNADGSGGQVRVSGGRVQIAAGTVDAAGDAGKVGGSVDVSGRAVSVAAGAEVRVGGSSGGTAKLVGTESVAIDGLVDAAGTVGSGGRIDTTASSVTVGARASLGASGATSGGQVRIGGGLQGAESDIANSRRTALERGSLVIADGAAGNGGQVVVWSDGGTLFEGEISAQARGSVGNGGFVEVSGRENLRIDGEVSTASANGRNGTFLVDPINITIAPVGGTMTDATLRGMVAANNVILHTGGVGAATGDISILSGSKVIYDSPNSLTFLANGDIFVDGDIKNIGSTDTTNTGHITLVAGWDGTLPAGPLNMNVSAADFINPDGTPRATPGQFGNWGSLGNSIFLNETGAEAVEVGSARGQTNLFGDTIQMRTGRADGRFVQVGYRRVADNRDTIALGGFGGYFGGADQIVDGAINLSARTSVIQRQSEEFDASDLEYVRSHTYNLIGHGGTRRADNAIDFLNAAATSGFGYDAGYVGVDDGRNTGAIVVYAGQSLLMDGGRVNSPTMIGHGGHGGAAPNGSAAAGAAETPGTNFARAGLGAAIIGDQGGDIRVTAGFIDMEAGLYSDAPVQIGHGGLNVRGELSGNITVTTTTGSIRGKAAQNLGAAGPASNVTEGRWFNNRDRSYVMIGHGGSSSFHNSALPARSGVAFVTQNGVDFSTPALLSSAAGDGIRINPLTLRPYGHNGNISVTSARGINFTATGNSGFAMIGHGGETSHGDHRGNLSVVAQNGSIVFNRIAIQVDVNGLDRRNVGANAFVQIGHQGRRSSGGGTGDILVSATGNIEFYAGRSEAYAQIGHGGRGDDTTTTITHAQRGATRASGTHSGNITVTAGTASTVGDIRFRSGFGTGGTAYSMIGHGGFLQHADVVDPGGLVSGSLVGGGAPSADQQGHNGTITVTASRDISFIAGQTEAYEGQDFGVEMNRTDNFTMIGNGGRTSWGDHWGAINVTAGRNIQFEARGGWNAITYEGTNEGPYNMVTGTTGAALTADLRGTPRYSIEEDDGATGIRNFAMIGNGGWDANHRLQSTVVKTSTNGDTAVGPLLQVAGLTSDDILKTGVPHGFVNGDTVTFQSVTGSTGLAANNTVYFVINSTANTFQVSTTAGGTAVDLVANLVNNTRDHSGAMGAGIGTAGPSPITINAGGNVEFEAAQIAKVGARLPTRAILSKNSTTNRIVYYDVFGNPVALDATVSPVSWYPDIVNRVQPNLLPATDTTRGPGGESMGRLNIGVTDYRLSTDTTAANQNRFIMSQGSGFGTNPAIAGGEIVYLTGIGVTELGLSTTQPYQVFNVRVNEADFQLRTIGTNGQLGAAVTVGLRPAGPIALNQTWHGWAAPEPVAAAQDSFAQIGNGGRSTNYLGGGNLRGASDGLGHRGDITINAGGVVSMKAGTFDPAVATGQSMAIRRIAYNRTTLLDSAGVPHIDILVGPGAPNGTAPALSTMVGTNFGTSGTDTRSQLNPSFRLYNYGMIGSGGWTARGDHRSNISITSGRNTTGVGLLLQAGEGREEFAQIGSGGFDSDGYDPLGALNNDNNRLNDDGSSGTISITTTGNVIVQGGGVNTKVVGRTGTTTDTTATAPAAGAGYNASGLLVDNADSQYSYAQIGNGGALNGGSHTGNVSVVSTGGGLTVAGGRSVRYNYAQIGHGGFQARGAAHSGTVTVRAANDLNVQAGSPFRDTGVLINNLNVPSSLGQISHASFNYAQIGHGGFDADPQGTTLDLAAGLGGFTGDIEVISVSGNVNVRGGGDPTLTRNDDTFFRSLTAQIGHGGNFTDGDHGGAVKVVAGNNLTLAGAAGGRDSFTMIGHGGLEINGNLSGEITVVTGNNLVMNRGADTDTSAAGTTNRAGAQLFNNYTKIGHGDQYYQQRNESFGTRNGDILISIGNSASLGQTANRPYAAAAYTRARADSVLIGHIDSRVSFSDPFRALNGNTFIAVGRNNPGATGTGQLITNADTIIASATEGASSQLRLYLSNPAANQIAEGTFLNNATYTRVPTPDGTRPDETIALEHGLTTGAFGEPEPDPGFTPVGAYPTHGFGLYNLYYSGVTTVEPVPPIPPVPPVPPVTPAPPYDFLGFFAADTFDAFFRDDELFFYDGYDEVLASIAYEDAMEDESPVATGGTFLEEVLDSSVGDRRYSEIEPGSDVIEDENDEELRRRQLRSSRPVGKGSLTYYVYNPGTNRYSSYRVFGVEQTRLSVTR
jgi:filamentous hemagglutinin family protein